MESHRIAVVRAAYDSFNAKDAAGVLALCVPDVEMPDIIHGVVLKGREAVEAYWSLQFSVADHEIAVGDVSEVGDTVVAVVRHQLYDLHAQPLGDGVTAVHRFTFRGELISRMEYSGLDEVPEGVRRQLT